MVIDQAASPTGQSGQAIEQTFSISKSVKGNNPCSILKLNSLDLKGLGFLLAIYEHKVFIEALILGIDPFDQWGVQLGKRIVSKSSEDKEYLVKYFSNNFLPKS